MNRSFSGAEALHLFLEELRLPGLAVRRRHTRFIEAGNKARQVMHARRESTLDCVAQEVLIAVGLAVSRLVRIEIARSVHSLALDVLLIKHQFLFELR